jgi:hypothetical protein
MEKLANDRAGVDDPSDKAALSEDDRRRIIAESRLREELRRELATGHSSSAKSSRNTASALLNSPFVLTVVGGLLLSLAAAVLQHRYADIENDRAYVRAVREKKFELMRTFLADLDLQLRCSAWLLNTLPSVEAREKSRTADLNSAYSLQKLKDYQDIHQLYLKTPQAAAYADQINALFPSAEVHKKMDSFLAAQASAVADAGTLSTNAQNNASVQDAAYKLVTDRTRQPRLDLLVAMQEDIKNTTPEGR